VPKLPTLPMTLDTFAILFAASNLFAVVAAFIAAFVTYYLLVFNNAEVPPTKPFDTAACAANYAAISADSPILVPVVGPVDGSM